MCSSGSRLAPAAAAVLLASLAVRSVTAESEFRSQLPSALVLSGDDSCSEGDAPDFEGGVAECGVHLLQRKGAHLAAAAQKASAAKATTDGSAHGTARGISRERAAAAAIHRPSGLQASRVAAAVVADELVGDLPAVAVSFMQEEIQHVSVALPPSVHQALLGTAAAQIATLLTSLTLMVLMARCMLLLREKRRVHAEGKGLQEPLDVDPSSSSTSSSGADDLLDAVAAATAAAAVAVVAAATTSSATLSAPAESGSPASEAEMADLSQLWLCPELVAPRGVRCVIAVPVLPPAPRPEVAMATPTVARVVTDRVGQPLFRICVSTLPGSQGAAAGAGAEVGHTEQLTIARQDGTCLAECHLHLPAGPASRKGVECNILKRDGAMFACLRREPVKASWLSQARGVLGKRAAPEPAEVLNFVSAAGPSTWQLKVQGNLAERSARMVDGAGRVLAEVGRGASFGFDMRGQEFYRLETGSELDTDLGLVTIALLAMNRVLTTYSS